MKDIHILERRMCKAEVLIWVQNLHHDEAGISELCDLLLRADHARVCTNVAWIFSHLSQEDKMLYLSSRYEELVRLVLSSEVPVRLGLLLSLLLDLSTKENFRSDLLDFCLCHLSDRKYTAGDRSYMIHLAARLYGFYPELKQELELSLEFLAEDPAPSVVTARHQVLKKLRGKKKK